MYPMNSIPRSISVDIDRVLQANRNKCIAVYGEAEKIRRKWEEENVALEDIVMAFIERCGFHEVAMSLDPSAAAEALGGRPRGGSGGQGEHL